MSATPEPTEQDREAAHALVVRAAFECVGYLPEYVVRMREPIAAAIAAARVRAHAEGRRDGLREAGIIARMARDRDERATGLVADMIANAIAARAAGTGEAGT